MNDHDDADHQDHSEIGEMDVRVRALETVLAEKGYIDPAALDALIDTYQTRIGPRNGARVVARAWIDAAFRAWLLRDATAAIASLGYSGRQGEQMMALANTAERAQPRGVHAVQLLPVARARPATGLVQERAVSLARRAGSARRARRFRRQAAGGPKIRVWDSTAEVRYLVCRCGRPAAMDSTKSSSRRW